MAMTAEAGPPLEIPAGRIIVPGVDWRQYEQMLQIAGDRHIHVTYDAGLMEIRTSSQRHGQASQLFGFFVLQVADEMEIDYEPLGMTTWKRPDMEKGLEADQCYYLGNAAVVREREELDLEVDPPPDLAVEVDIASSSLNRMGIYAGLRVPEVWRYDGRTVTIYQLQADGAYRACETSPNFPGLRPEDILRSIEMGRTMPKRQWAREIRAFVRAELIPHRNRPVPRDDAGPAPA